MATAQLFLSGARVTPDFREALHDAANRAGITPNEFVITAAAEKLPSGVHTFAASSGPATCATVARGEIVRSVWSATSPEPGAPELGWLEMGAATSAPCRVIACNRCGRSYAPPLAHPTGLIPSRGDA